MHFPFDRPYARDYAILVAFIVRRGTPHNPARHVALGYEACCGIQCGVSLQSVQGNLSRKNVVCRLEEVNSVQEVLEQVMWQRRAKGGLHDNRKIALARYNI